MPETKNTMIADLVALQKALPVMPKDAVGGGTGTFKYKYTTLDTITENVFPIMTKHNFAWTTCPGYSAQGPTLEYALRHTSGEVIEGSMLLLLNKQDPQGQGSAITYARRYAITSVLGIVSDADDDGEAARKAVQFAKTTSNEYKAPEEPSRDVADEPISEGSLTKLRLAFATKGIKGAEVTTYNMMVINKEVPTTEQDAQELITQLATK